MTNELGGSRAMTKPTIWHRFPLTSAPMPFQMALDEVLFSHCKEKKVETPVLRFYFSSEPWMTIGYSDHLPLPAGIKVCRRMTGGGRVMHGRDLLFSLIACKQDDESFASVRISYWKIHDALKKTLEKAGENPRFYRCDENLPRGDKCFTFPIATDLELQGQKIAGGAQKRSLGALLHQESLQLPARFHGMDFIQKFYAGFEEEFKIQFQDMACDPEILEKASILAAEKYARHCERP